MVPAVTSENAGLTAFCKRNHPTFPDRVIHQQIQCTRMIDFQYVAVDIKKYKINPSMRGPFSTSSSNIYWMKLMGTMGTLYHIMKIVGFVEDTFFRFPERLSETVEIFQDRINLPP
jgi:hypothetical protein